jgi:hypothetical protein
MDEPQLKSYLLQHFGKDFTVRDEVDGSFLVDGTPVEIDYLMYPSEKLIEQGFVKEWFGVEVKAIGEGPKKGLQVAWQSITYSQSKFDGIRPAFVLIYPPITEFFGAHINGSYIKMLLQKANVGYIEINKFSKVWKIMFGANSYFYSDMGLSKTPNIATKRNVGSWK